MDKTEFDNFFNSLKEIIVDGLHHGFFKFTISSEIIKGEKRCLTVDAGKSHRFFISNQELD
jgi:hypothetical protein